MCWRMSKQHRRRTRRAAGDLLEVDVRRQGLAARVHLQDGDAALDVRAVDRHLQHTNMYEQVLTWNVS